MRVVSHGLWSDVGKLARKNRPAFAAFAYVSSDTHMKFAAGDVLVCDASDGANASSQTSARVLRDAVERGAEVFSSPGLHAKAMVLGRDAIVGSANMSASSGTAPSLSDSTAIPFATFRALWARAGGASGLSVNSTRQVSPEIAATIEGLWPRKRR